MPSARVSLILLLVMAMTTGGLLRPCDCPGGPIGACPVACERDLPADHSHPDHSQRCAGHAHGAHSDAAPSTSPAATQGRDGRGLGTLALCPKGALAVLASSPEPSVGVHQGAPPVAALDTWAHKTAPRRRSRAMSSAPPDLAWRLVPAALSAFLI